MASNPNTTSDDALAASPGARIRQFRREQKLTQSEMGKKLGISKSAISNYEKNNAKIPIETRQKFLDTFEFDPNETLDGRPDSFRILTKPDDEIASSNSQETTFRQRILDQMRKEFTFGFVCLMLSCAVTLMTLYGLPQLLGMDPRLAVRMSVVCMGITLLCCGAAITEQFMQSRRK